MMDLCRREGCDLPVRPGKPYCHGHLPIEFIEQNCTHIKGRWAGHPFKFIDWQYDLVMKAFGTLKPNGTRQYRTVYVEIPKKNGKSELASALALYMVCADGELGAEVYSAAGDTKQAGLVFKPATQMVHNDDALSGRLTVFESTNRIIDYETNSFYEVLSAEVHTKHGLNPSAVIIDEIHAQKTRDLYDVLTEGTDIAREQQLVLIITTAGLYDKNSIGWEIHHYAQQVKDGVIDDPTFLPIIYGADKDEDWEDPKLWERVNPSLGSIFHLDNLETHYKQSLSSPTRVNNFKRYRLNMWTNSLSKYMPMDHWDACGEQKFDVEKLVGRECYGGLDLSSTIDLTCFCLVFPPLPGEKDELYYVVPFYYVPEDGVKDRAKIDKVPYDMWVEAKRIIATPGNVVDYAYIRRDINRCSIKFDLREVAYDDWGAIKLAVELENEDDITMVQHRQGFKSMSGPTKEMHKTVMSEKLRHNDHPVLRWNADNLVIQEDAAENVKPAKDKSLERIDGMVALIMALGRAVLHTDNRSVYTTRGVLVL